MYQLTGGFSQYRGAEAREATESQSEQKEELDKDEKNNKKHTKSNKNRKKKNQKERKIKYRGRGKVNKREDTFSVLLVNLRGYVSKERSLKKVLKKTKPSMVALNETLLTGKRKVSLLPYTSWTKNRSEKGGGGIASAVAQSYKDCAVSAGEGEGDDEFLVTKLDCFRPALCVVNCYGEQRKTSKGEVEQKWKRLR